jgi:cyclopropane fatty-acyl-phospholipid synthase-like methyltransferase
VFANEMGPNALWLTEWLCEDVALKPGMRVLDMGCGRAMSSIFLAREFGVQVWANDLWIAAGDNWERIRAAGVEERVFPIHAEAHALPYADGFFDAILSVDSYHYYGTDDLYLSYMMRVLRPGGSFGIVVPGLTQPLPEAGVPEHLQAFWDPKECFSFHTLDWWRQHLTQPQLLDVEVADLLEDGCREWAEFVAAQVAAGADMREWTKAEGEQVAADDGRYLGFIRVAGRRLTAEPS